MANDTFMLTGGVTQEVYNIVNEKSSKTDKVAIANAMLKGAVNIGTAVINLLSSTGIAGFKFHIPETEQIRLESEITDYYTDLNSPVNDHIVRKPVTITMTGLVGEYFYSVNKISDMLARVVPTLSLVKQFMPTLTTAAKMAIVKNSKIANGFNKITSSKLLGNVSSSIKSVVGGVPSQNESTLYTLNAMDLFLLFQNLYKLKSAQTRAYLFFEALWKSQASFSVETTWKRFDNMVVQSVVPMRDNNADITEFTITVKQINFVQSKTETLEAVAGRMKEQAAAVSDKGVDKGQEVSNV